MKKGVLFCLIALCFHACNYGYGSKFSSEKLDVYFVADSLEKYAESLGDYWASKGLIGSRKQFLKVGTEQQKFTVSLIQSPELEEKLSLEETALLRKLKDSLQENVFKGNKVELFICDKEFQPKYAIN